MGAPRGPAGRAAAGSPGPEACERGEMGRVSSSLAPEPFDVLKLSPARGERERGREREHCPQPGRLSRALSLGCLGGDGVSMVWDFGCWVLDGAVLCGGCVGRVVLRSGRVKVCSAHCWRWSWLEFVVADASSSCLVQGCYTRQHALAGALHPDTRSMRILTTVLNPKHVPGWAGRCNLLRSLNHINRIDSPAPTGGHEH